MRITRFGHSAVLVDVAGSRILIDPGSFSAPEAFEQDDLAAIVVTHQHADHLDRERIGALLARNPDAVRLADPETAATVDGFTAHGDGDTHVVGAVSLTGVGTTHAEILPTIPRITNTGVLISATGEPTIFHPGDAYEYAPSSVDVLALPLSAPWANVAQTVDFVQRVASRVVFPIHDAGVSALMHPVYWGHVSTHGGVPDARLIEPTGVSHI